MRITTKGQVTIPIEVRERLGLLPHTEVSIYVRGDQAVLEKVRSGGGGPRRRGESLVARMANTGTVRMTTDEIMSLTRGR